MDARPWDSTCWSVAVWTAPAPFAALLGQTVPLPVLEQEATGLAATSALALVGAVVALHRCGRAPDAGTVAWAALGLLGTVLAALLLLEARDHENSEITVAVVALGLPHVALAGLAWPGLLGLGQRVAVSLAAACVLAPLCLAGGVLLLIAGAYAGDAVGLGDLADPMGVVVVGGAVALGHASVLWLGSVLAPPRTRRALLRT